MFATWCVYLWCLFFVGPQAVASINKLRNQVKRTEKSMQAKIDVLVTEKEALVAFRPSPSGSLTGSPRAPVKGLPPLKGKDGLKQKDLPAALPPLKDKKDKDKKEKKEKELTKKESQKGERRGSVTRRRSLTDALLSSLNMGRKRNPSLKIGETTEALYRKHMDGEVSFIRWHMIMRDLWCRKYPTEDVSSDSDSFFAGKTAHEVINMTEKNQRALFYFYHTQKSTKKSKGKEKDAMVPKEIKRLARDLIEKVLEVFADQYQAKRKKPTTSYDALKSVVDKEQAYLIPGNKGQTDKQAIALMTKHLRTRLGKEVGIENKKAGKSLARAITETSVVMSWNG